MNWAQITGWITSEAQLVDISNIVVNNEASVKSIPSNSLTGKNKDTVAMQESHATVTVHESHYTLDQSSSKSAPIIILKGCTFSGCTIAFSGAVSSVSNDSVAAEVLQLVLLYSAPF